MASAVMPRISLVTNVAEYALLRGLARSRGRLIVSSVTAVAATIAMGLWSAHYVLELSDSVGLNLALITANMMMMLVSAYLETVLVGDIFFGPAWREQVILGETPETGATVKDHNAEFMIVLLGLVVTNAAVINTASGGFMDTYHTEGFFRSGLRSAAAEDRLAALTYMTDPINFEVWPVPGVQNLVLQHLDDPDEDVRSAAIWNAGEMDILSARTPLIEIVGSDAPTRIRADAAEALGKLGNDTVAREALESHLADDEPARLRIAAFRGLALMKSPLSVDAVTPHAGTKDSEVMIHALWVLRETGEPAVRQMLRAELERPTDDPVRTCALLDALKMVANDEDVMWARRQFERVDAETKCEPVVWEERNERQYYVLYSDTLRVKYLKIVANASGAKQRAWFERLIADPQQPWRVREVANEIVKRLDKAGKR